MKLCSLYYLLIPAISLTSFCELLNAFKVIENVSIEKGDIPVHLITAQHKNIKMDEPSKKGHIISNPSKKRIIKTDRIPELFSSGVRNWIQNSVKTDFALRHLQNLKEKLLTYYSNKSNDIVKGRDVGIGFPSLEGALLSLAFLTFAVFLIDLVQTLLSRLRGVQVVNGKRTRRSFSQKSEAAADTFSTLTSRIFSSIESPLFN